VLNKTESLSVEKKSEKLTAITGLSPSFQKIASGFRFVEGPVWIKEKDLLIFSDIMGNALYSWSEKEGSKLYRPNSFLANGNTLDREGRLITCEHGASRVSRTDMESDTYSVLADKYNGMALNSPNDVVVKSNGDVYFTDPLPGRSSKVGIPRQQELSFQGIYRLDAASGKLDILDDSFSLPNGLCFSPDESILYVDDSSYGTITAFELNEKGLGGNKHLWAKADGNGEGVVDGMKCTNDGHIFCTGPGGIYIFDPEGDCLGRLILPEISANLTWGENQKTLYITARTSVYRVFLD
jgi:gluconolactonase